MAVACPAWFGVQSFIPPVAQGRGAVLPQPVASPQPARPRPSLEGFVGHPAYSIQHLREDLDRFTFLLGGSDGEPLFSPTQH
jgi:hypothetical protein